MDELRIDFRSRSTPKQFTALLEFMESRGDIGKPLPGVQRRIKADRLWQELADLLNSMGGGPIRTTEKWKKVWADWKAKTKKKVVVIRREARAGGSRHTLSGLERRVLRIMGLGGAVPREVHLQPKALPSPPASPPPPPSPSPPPSPQAPIQPPLTAHTPAEEVIYGFVAVEHRRMHLEEVRERNQHERELEKLRLESRRIELEVNQNQTLSRLADVLNDLTGILSNFKPLSPQ